MVRYLFGGLINSLVLGLLTIGFFKSRTMHEDWANSISSFVGNINEEGIRKVFLTIIILGWIICVGPYIIDATYVLRNNYPQVSGTAIYSSYRERNGNKVVIETDNGIRYTIWIRNKDIKQNDRVTVRYFPCIKMGELVPTN